MSDATEEVHLTDFRMAGFLVARGRRFVRTMSNDRGEVTFVFSDVPDDHDQTATDVLNQYPGSPEFQYDAACRTMHDFTKMKQSVGRSGRRP